MLVPPENPNYFLPHILLLACLYLLENARPKRLRDQKEDLL